MFKICPRCGDEFVPSVSECPDCRVPLEAPDAARTPAPRTDPRERAPLALADAVPLRRGDPGELRQIAEALAAAGVACAIDTDPPGEEIRAGARARREAYALGAPLAVYVATRDREAAGRVLAQWLASSVPDAAHAAPAGFVDACPGCSEPLPEHATSCGSCGLEFPPLEVACPACGRAVAAEAESCASCGHRP